MRFYDVAVASLAIDAPRKWTDNVLSQHHVADVMAPSRGIARRIPYPALLQLALTRQLHVSLGLAVRDALALAHELLAARGEVAAIWRGSVRIECDRTALERELDLRLRETLESAPAPRRGRPVRRRIE